MQTAETLSVIEAALAKSGLTARGASLAAGSPYVIRDLRRGHAISARRLAHLCTALDLEFYIGPRRAPQATKTPLISSPPAPPVPVRYRALAELLSAISEHYEALGEEYARRDFLNNVYATSSELRARRSGEGRKD